MGGFYDEWLERRNSGTDDYDYISAFICSAEETVQPLFTGSNEELALIFAVLKMVPIEDFFHVVKIDNKERELTPADIPCFSTLKNGASRLNELLEFEPDGFTFSEAGYQLINAIKPIAQIKYGENHSKLAAMMNLVVISTNRPSIVKATPWGKYLTRYNWHAKKDVLRKLLLRNICIKTIISNALNGSASYQNIVKALSKSTAIRRRTSVKCLIKFVLSESKYEDVLYRIDWAV